MMTKGQLNFRTRKVIESLTWMHKDASTAAQKTINEMIKTVETIKANEAMQIEKAITDQRAAAKAAKARTTTTPDIKALIAQAVAEALAQAAPKVSRPRKLKDQIAAIQPANTLAK